MLPYNAERPWLKAVLIPCWIMQDLICVVVIGLCIWDIVGFRDFEAEYDYTVLVKYATSEQEGCWKCWADDVI